MGKRTDPDIISDEGIKDLMAAICIQAGADYKKSLTGKYTVTKFGTMDFCLQVKGEWMPAKYYGIEPPEAYEAFFHSSWFMALSDILNGDKVVEYLKETKDIRRYGEP